MGGTLRLPRSRPAVAEQPVRIAIKAAPAIRGVYSRRYPDAALPPEFSKRRPVMVVSWKNSLAGPVLMIPITTQSQSGNPWALRLPRNPCPGETCEVWAVCNHLYTVSCTRLTATHGSVPRLTVEEFRPVHELMLKWVPALHPPDD
jgi:mRNA interferase MazF